MGLSVIPGARGAHLNQFISKRGCNSLWPTIVRRIVERRRPASAHDDPRRRDASCGGFRPRDADFSAVRALIPERRSRCVSNQCCIGCQLQVSFDPAKLRGRTVVPHKGEGKPLAAPNSIADLRSRRLGKVRSRRVDAVCRPKGGMSIADRRCQRTATCAGPCRCSATGRALVSGNRDPGAARCRRTVTGPRLRVAEPRHAHGMACPNAADRQRSTFRL